MITLPENWSDWRVTGELGRGSYSVVYAAERKDDPSVHCAIKVITIPQDDSEYDDLIADGFNTELSRSFFEEAVKDFTREIRMMENFKGMQNIVSIEDYKVVPKEDGVGSHIFIRMELLTSLEKYINDKTLTEKEVIQIGVDICTALEFCQEKHIIHRDIKPANIFVNDRLGTHVFYKLGDFGIARNLEGKTQDLSTKGTPNYMAPEVAACMKYNATADIYSLGLTLYWLLNGNRLPFFPQTQLYTPAAKREALQRRLSGEQIEPPVNASPELSEVILKACSYRPEDRWQTASEMKAALLKLQRAEATEETAENGKSAAGSAPETPKKKRSILLKVLAAAAVLALTGAGIRLLQGRPPEGNEQPTEPVTIAPTEEVTETPKPDATETVTVTPEPAPTETPAETPVPETEPPAAEPTPDLSRFQQADESCYTYEVQEDGTAGIKEYRGAKDIKALELPSTLDGIPVSTVFAYAFNSASAEEILIPEGITTIQSCAFTGCDRLIRVYFPSSLGTIKGSPFQRCSNLQELILSEENHSFTVKDDVMFDRDMQKLLTYAAGKKDYIYHVPDTVREIGDYAFANAGGLQGILLPDRLERIGRYAFFQSGLTMIELPETLVYIGSYAFYETNIRSVKIPDGITEINPGVFYRCHSLTEVTLPEHMKSIGKQAFSSDVGLNEIRLPAELEQIGDSAFLNCLNLERIEIPASVTSIGSNPFGGCTGLDRIIVAKGNERFYTADNVLFDKTEQRLISYPNSKQQSSYTVPEGTITIGANAFLRNRNLMNITFPETLFRIEDQAFRGCESLITVQIPDTLYEMGEAVFEGCSALCSVHLTEKLLIIRDRLFALCTNLTEVNIPPAVREIEQSAFTGCESLTALTVYAGVESIGDGAFENCGQLTMSVQTGSAAEKYCRDNGIMYVAYNVLETPGDSPAPETEAPAAVTEEPVPDWLRDD